MTKEDKRCCGSGACIINDNGECWCGQRWDGEKMSYPIIDHQTSENKNEGQN